MSLVFPMCIGSQNVHKLSRGCKYIAILYIQSVTLCLVCTYINSSSTKNSYITYTLILLWSTFHSDFIFYQNCKFKLAIVVFFFS